MSVNFFHRAIKITREPLLQFLLIGAAIYGAYSLFGPPKEDVNNRTVVVDSNRIETFISQWEGRWNRPPTRQELDGIINAYVQEEILYRQAVAIGLDKDDPITRRRVAQKLVFLTRNIALLKEPEKGELEQFFADNLGDYRDPDLITFAHVFVDPDARDKTTLSDADALLKQLQAAGIPDAATISSGDRFMLESHYSEISELGIRRLFGGGFSEVVMKLEPKTWHGPVLSGFGVHLVYVFDQIKAPAPDFATVRERVLANWQTVQQETFNTEFITSLKSTYDIVIGETPKDRILGGNMDTKLGPRVDKVVKVSK